MAPVDGYGKEIAWTITAASQRFFQSILTTLPGGTGTAGSTEMRGGQDVRRPRSPSRSPEPF